ncbi:MAG TPA: glucose-6-phosphate isomerase family protein [Trueperaceae bacterium]|nr:glucose-6-phosphate isomerase family protein [Trueperaceae bacterium]
MDYFEPLTRFVDLKDGTIPTAHAVQSRHLSDLKGLFNDATAEAALLTDDPLLYEVFEAADIPREDGHLLFSTTVLRPGVVGNEYFMTKGHYHARADRSELYYGLAGEGLLLMQTPEGRINVQPMRAGSACYVPPYWGHRSINVGTDNLVFLAAYPADAGYRYGPIAEGGFAQIVVAGSNGPELVRNPRYREMPGRG